MTECKGEIGHRDILERISSSGRFVRRFAKSTRELPETLDGNRGNDRIPVFEM